MVVPMTDSSLHNEHSELDVRIHHRLPVIAAFCHRLGLVECFDQAIPNPMEVSVGKHVMAMVLDCFQGRRPLWRVEKTFEDEDTELLFGEPIQANQFNDDALGRTLDRLQQAGTGSLFTGFALQCCRRMKVPLECGHMDVTSVKVYGDDYQAREDTSQTIGITHGYSKDKRPELRQFLIRHMCVGGDIPLMGGACDGNQSEKKINNQELSKLSELLAREGIEAERFTYVADSAMVSEANLREAAQAGIAVVSRLPATYSRHDELIGEALELPREQWIQMPWDDPQCVPSRRGASYCLRELPLELYGLKLRAVVVHSDRHDKRRHKKIERQVQAERERLEKLTDAAARTDFACAQDARAAFARLSEEGAKSRFHRIEGIVGVKTLYEPGRPRKDRPRRVREHRPAICAQVVAHEQALAKAREQAGCFVLITSLGPEVTPEEVLRIYKGQNRIERNFSFLKDDAIVNSIFLERPERIEALTLVLLIALLVWNLIRFQLRRWVEHHDQPLPGLGNRPTRKPTTFAMLEVLDKVLVLLCEDSRKLIKPLWPTIMAYLQSLELSPDIYTKPPPPSHKHA